MPPQDLNRSIGAVIVTFNSADVIRGCLDSLVAQVGARVRVVVVENASTDTTVQVIREWAVGRADAQGAPLMAEETVAGTRSDAQVILLHSGVNRGFAGGVNVGLARLEAEAEIAHFWVLNPDAYATEDAAQAILSQAARQPGYGLMGGRVCYADPPQRIQMDGGLVNMWTGTSGNYNLGRPRAEAAMPRADDIDFISGANVIASRAFYQAVGPMAEDYFLYYEEVDWALRRGNLPMVVAPDLLVFHHAGTSIGSPTLERLASPFSFWFKYRSRMKFVRRFNPMGLPVAVAYATAKALQLAAKGAMPQAGAILRAVFVPGPPRYVTDRLSPEAARIAFGARA